MPRKQKDASELNKRKEVCGLVFVARSDAAIAEQPRKEAFDFPAPTIPSQLAAILLACTRPRAGWRDEVDVLVR